MRTFIQLLLCISIFCNISCKQKVDIIFTNANIYNSDSTKAFSKCFAVKNGKIILVGDSNQILKNYKCDSIINLQNKFVYPGFNDAHCHFVGYAGDMFKCQLYNTSSFEEVIERLLKYADTTSTEFIYGRGWNQNDWKEKNFPNNILLNKNFLNKIVFLKRIDGHAALINQALIEQAHDVLMPFMNTSYVEKKNGKLTGIIFDNAMDAVENMLPKIPRSSLIKNIIRAQQDCLALGITSLSDAGLSYDEIQLIDSLQKCNVLKLKINTMLMAKAENLKKFESHPINSTSLLKVQSLKVYCDGALGSRGACLKKPYQDDPTNYGKINMSKAEFDQICDWAIKHNFQVCAHAIGDSTVSFVLQSYKKFLQPNNNLRWRVEHVQVCSPIDIQVFNTYNIIASVQPTHATSDMYWAADRLGDERIKNAYCLGTLLKNNVSIALGTDFPVEYLQPLYTFYAAVSRKDSKQFPALGFQMKDALSRNQALFGITSWPAYAEFSENEKGKLEANHAADFIVCDFNLLKDAPINIRNSDINATYVNGKLQWCKK
jgi:predicted amidohydrolase YtcJ